MAGTLDIPNLDQARAVIVHPAPDHVAALMRQLNAIGLSVTNAWPDLPASAITADFIFYDTDMGHDAQFPWGPGTAPMPMIALVGTEAPGRIEWAARMGADALLLKPVGSSGAFSALLMARHSFELRRTLTSEIKQLRQRMSARQTVVQAVALLSAQGKSQDAAYDQLRQLAMAWRINVEEAAARIVKNATDKGILRDSH
ncbi:ANTAR domain-containing response regulator [Sedimentitalea nanhaiensis]|uniref:Two-component response regulator, AmiR/NasT family, consists of REC and RNA-binding antiterminator (ANTAR) domains n=1 Tax=Sedimentitalea nanhaiensis TaxID=999627 RepID=A0A1I7C4A8_9RHOB|nr:ANTAR domain-containing protein [Sedimentitalea nanhaiensis]SFT94263.1 Two-component response regulator, AmiR/NasT family, consists of REC and RNA-binding antiterminator (ANTAR) domains [Sedimentitalea nanhaiensis]